MGRPPDSTLDNKPHKGQHSSLKSQQGVSITKLLEQGTTLHQQGQLPKAEEIYRAILTQEPNQFDALHLLGVIALQSKKPLLAVKCINKAIQVNPMVVAPLINIGLALKELGRHDEALASFDKAIVIQSNCSEAFNYRGIVLKELELFDEALASYKKAITFNPNYAEAFFNRGIALKSLDRPVEAINSYAQAINIKPDYAEAFYNSGAILKELNRLEDALNNYDQAITINPQHVRAHNNRGIILKELGRLDEALASHDKAIIIYPNSPEAFYNCGLVLYELNRFKEALVSFDSAIVIKPDYAEALYSRGNTLHKLELLQESLSSFDRAITIKSDYFEAYSNSGAVLKALNRLDDALASYNKAIEINQHSVEAYFHSGSILLKLNRFDEALAQYNKVIDLKPDYADGYNNRGNVLLKLKCFEEALTSYNKAIELMSDYAEAFCNRGIVLTKLNRIEEALLSYEKAITIKPDYEAVFINRGNTLFSVECFQEALASYNKVIMMNPSSAVAYHSCGIALSSLKRMGEALSHFEKAIALKPDYVEAFNGRGSVLKFFNRLQEALASYDKAIAIKADDADALYNRGNVLFKLERLNDALASYDAVIAINSDNVEALTNRGHVLLSLKRIPDAVASYEKALAIKPDAEFLLGAKYHLQMNLCDWSELPARLTELETGVAEGRKITDPFALLALFDKPEVHLQASKVYADAYYSYRPVLPALKMRKSDGRIRIGYYSADFHNHATTYLMAELFESHNKQKFELYAFSFGPNASDGMRQRITAGFNHFLSVANKSDYDIALMSRELGIDIAVDLKGYTQNARPGIFAERCAPIQVSYLGYPSTSGASFIEYIIADKTLIPQKSKQYYSEKVVYLPNSYQVNDSKRQISSKLCEKKYVGLPDKSFVFCCFNNSYKILPEIFNGWMRILKATKGSVLWLLESNNIAAKNLRKEAESRGVDSRRLVFAKIIKLEDHLGRYRLADLFLDTLPYNAHTTASDALWAGLPVLTLKGRSFAGRVSSSLLSAMELQELVTEKQDLYEEKAIELANKPKLLNEIKMKIERNRLTTSLFNGQVFSRHLEAAFTEIYKRHLMNKKPDHIYIS